jgi:hypothetical protein
MARNINGLGLLKESNGLHKTSYRFLWNPLFIEKKRKGLRASPGASSITTTLERFRYNNFYALPWFINSYLSKVLTRLGYY